MNIVVVNPSGASLSSAQQLSDQNVLLVTWQGTALPDDAGVRTLSIPRPQRGAFGTRLTSRLSGSALGRNALRLTPLDTGRAFARSAGRDTSFRSAIAQADMVIAAERDAILTVWRIGRELSSPTAHLIYGMAPAQSLLAEG
jgi:hypothetical protein